MGFLKKKPDPISDRERQLAAEIAALEGQIKKLTTTLQDNKSQPKLRSTVMAHPSGGAAPSPDHRTETVFEAVDHHRLRNAQESPPQPYSSQARWRQWNLKKLWDHCVSLFRGPEPTNRKLLSLLAAGNVQGLRPLRYEKRVTRNRLIFLVIAFVAVLWGLLALALKNR